MISIRNERPGDEAAIRAVHEAAFDTGDEAHLVDLLRKQDSLRISLVAELGGRIIAHAAFSDASIDTCEARGLALAPVAVEPAHQRQGIGSRLIRAGLDRCREDGAAFVIVLGDPGYYPRFGFRRASKQGIGNEWDVDEPFMIIELTPNSLPSEGGMARYSPQFAQVFASDA